MDLLRGHPLMSGHCRASSVRLGCSVLFSPQHPLRPGVCHGHDLDRIAISACGEGPPGGVRGEFLPATSPDLFRASDGYDAAFYLPEDCSTRRRPRPLAANPWTYFDGTKIAASIYIIAFLLI